ncbi:MAG: hypothetical protein KC441_01710 [Anaerolineales bacterium]|nr:hypothetical protein [Anaerolineales bacterium]
MTQQMPNWANAVSEAKNEFHRARMRGALSAVGARMNGKSIALLSFNDVADKLKITGQATRGLTTIPVTAIVGSVGRYNDFTRTFLPLIGSDADRWASVRLAGPVASLPPIDVYKIGEAYFVLDGNHRVSIAMQQNLSYIDAYVVEIQTKVPLSPDDDPDSLIIKYEYAAFLERTRLDHLRPGTDLLVSVPGQYETLENLIEVHRFFMEMAQEMEMGDAEAVGHWYDEAYLPMVTAVREQGILRYFSGRTETDFYVWLATHQAHLRNELGLDLEPEVVVKLAAQFEPRTQPKKKSFPRQLLEAVTPRRQKQAPPEQRWSQARVVDRYSQSLFADVLVPLTGSTAVTPRSWATAVALCQREQAQVMGLVVGPEAADAAQELSAQLRQECQAVGVSVQIAQDGEDVTAAVCQRAALVDLVVLDEAFDRAQIHEILLQCPRPVMVQSEKAVELKRVLLAYDGSPRADEALFVAAYLAEQWPVDLVVITVLETRKLRTVAEHARRYLAMHEVTATFVEAQRDVTEVIQETAVAQSCDLILLGGSRASYKDRRRVGSTVEQLIDWGERPLLVCP